MPEESYCYCCGGEMLHDGFCRQCITDMDEDFSLFEEVLVDGRFVLGKDSWKIEELDFTRNHNGRMRA